MAPRLTRDQRRDVLLMRRLNHSYAQIASFLGITQRAVQYTCNTQRASPLHAVAGRPSRLSEVDGDRLEAYVMNWQGPKLWTYAHLAQELWPDNPEIGVESVKRTLHRRGYRRGVPPSRPATETVADSRENGTVFINWPVYESDLNPIETERDKVKEWLEEHHPGDTASFDELRKHIEEAHAAI